MKEKICKKQYNIFGYRIVLYFHDYKLAMEIDENGHSERNIDYEIKNWKKTLTEKTLISLELSMI